MANPNELWMDRRISPDILNFDLVVVIDAAGIIGCAFGSEGIAGQDRYHGHAAYLAVLQNQILQHMHLHHPERPRVLLKFFLSRHRYEKMRQKNTHKPYSPEMDAMRSDSCRFVLSDGRDDDEVLMVELMQYALRIEQIASVNHKKCLVIANDKYRDHAKHLDMEKIVGSTYRFTVEEGPTYKFRLDIPATVQKRADTYADMVANAKILFEDLRAAHQDRGEVDEKTMQRKIFALIACCSSYHSGLYPAYCAALSEPWREPFRKFCRESYFLDTCGRSHPDATVPALDPAIVQKIHTALNASSKSLFTFNAQHQTAAKQQETKAECVQRAARDAAEALLSEIFEPVELYCFLNHSTLWDHLRTHAPDLEARAVNIQSQGSKDVSSLHVACRLFGSKVLASTKAMSDLSCQLLFFSGDFRNDNTHEIARAIRNALRNCVQKTLFGRDYPRITVEGPMDLYVRLVKDRLDVVVPETLLDADLEVFMGEITAAYPTMKLCDSKCYPREVFMELHSAIDSPSDALSDYIQQSLPAQMSADGEDNPPAKRRKLDPQTKIDDSYKYGGVIDWRDI
jgi:hypothetical protein